jgi:hypothetical protein
VAAQGGARQDPAEISGLATGQTAGQASPPETDRGPKGYLRITRGRFEPATQDEQAHPLHEIATATQRLPGCRGYEALNIRRRHQAQ